MITINKTFQVTGAAEAQYSFTSSGNVTFSPQTGTVPSTGTINVTLNYESTDDFSSPIELKVNTASNCSQTYSFVESSPCSTLTASISKSGFTFTANASGGTQPYNYQWSYDTTVFKQTQATNSVLTLDLKDGISIPPSSSISLTVTDENGCEVSLNQSFSIEGPTIINKSVSTVCFDSPSNTICGYQVTQWVTVLFDANLDLDFDNAELSYDADKMCLIKVPNGYNIQIVDTNVDQVITGKIPNSDGIPSNEFTITIFTQSCANVQNEPVAETRVFTDTEFTAGITIDDFTFNADKNCFEFIASSGQTKVSNHELTGRRGTYTYFNGQIVYVDSGGTDNQEIVRYEICSLTDSTKKETGSLINNFEKLPAPVLADGTVCTSCDQTLSNVSIIPLITGDYDLSTLEIVTPATNTTVTINSNGTLNFTENTVFDTEDEVTIRIKNSDGVVSNTAAIQIKRACAGKVSNVTKNITCETKTFDLLDIISANTNYYTGAYTWLETTAGSNTYGDQSGTITGNVGAVDFTGIDAGTYTFKFGESSTCTATGGRVLLSGATRETFSNVSIIMDTEETIAITSQSSAVAGTGYNIQTQYTITDYDTLVDFKVFINGVETATSSNSVNAVLGNGFATIYVASTGSYAVKVQMRTKCNNIISDTDTIVIS
jgi:hypothetical protein